MAENDTAAADALKAEELAAGKAKFEASKGDDELAKAKAEVDYWKVLARKHEGQAKQNAEASQKLKEAEDAKKTAEERQSAKIAELADKVNATEARALRAEVAAAKGLSPAQAKRLQGTTQEELEADADDLLASFKPADKGGESDTDKAGKPKEALKGGASSEVQPEEDRATVLAAIPRI